MIPLHVDTPTPIPLTVKEEFVDYDVPEYTGSYEVTPSASTQVLPTNGKLMTDDVTVDAVSIDLQSKTVNPSTTAATVSPDVGYDGLSSVTVNAMPAGLLALPETAYSDRLGVAYIDVTVGVDDDGYVESSDGFTYPVKVNDIPSLPKQAAATITPTTSSQTAVTAKKWTTGAVTVDPIPSQYIVPTGTKSITANTSSVDVKTYEFASVNVPNSYAAGDEGKVVSNGALVAQTSDTVTTNDTYDTTLINSLTVNVSGGGGGEDFVKLVNGSITSIDNSDITTVRERAFAACGALTSVSLPNATSIGISAFSPGCTALASVYLPKVATISNNCFEGVACSTMAFPSLTSATGSYSLRNNTHLTAIDMGKCSSLGSQCFAGDTNLTTIVLRSTSITALGGGTAVFNNTPFKSGGSGGTIYIPKSLYDHLGDNSSSDYKKASNWVTVDGYGTITWAKIEGSYYETHYADGTPIT